MAPFPATSSSPGQGVLAVSVFPPSPPVLGTFTYTYPLKLISPRPAAHTKCILVFLLTYGGGLVSGDAIDLSVSVTASAKLAIVTQGSTKVFKAINRETVTRQKIDVVIEGDGALVYLPDPVQPFGASLYEQNQFFRLDPTRGNLCVLDWVSEGRTAMGERWKLWSWRGRNEVWSVPQADDKGVVGPGTLLLRDNMILREDVVKSPSGTLLAKMNGLGVFGTLVIYGQQFESLGIFFLSEFSLLPRLGGKDWSHSTQERHLSTVEEWRETRQRSEKSHGVLWTAAAVRGFVVVKFGAKDVEGARGWLRDMIKEEGSLEREFGEESMLCLK